MSRVQLDLTLGRYELKGNLQGCYYGDMARPKRKSKIDQACVNRLEADLADGSTFRMAAFNAGLNPASLTKRRSLGRGKIEAAEDTEGEELLGDWDVAIYLATERGRETWIQKTLGRIESAATNKKTIDWRAYAWLLERREHTRFGARQSIQMESTVTSKGPDYSKLSNKDLLHLETMMLKCTDAIPVDTTDT